LLAWVKPRLDGALELAGDARLMPLSAGTPHCPPPPTRERVFSEHGVYSAVRRFEDVLDRTY
jgi:hypothetical protein